MKQLLLIISLSCGFAYSQNSKTAQMDWILGTWKMETYDGGSYSEVWTKKDDDAFVGVGLALGAKGDTVFHEKMQIQWLENHVVYIAIPGDNNPTLFTLKSDDEGQFLFVNEEHDYPSELTYSLDDQGRLNAWVAGNMEGERVEDVFGPMSRK